jgi:hypothetical protein
MSVPIDLVGQRFGRLVVHRKHIRRAVDGGLMWICLCDCNTSTVVYTGHLRSGHTKSCGCFRDEKASEINKTHGLAKTPEYKIWRVMLQRCFDKRCDEYDNYGGRGITVCDSWKNSFESFYQDMKPRPTPEHTLDRRENGGNYELSNCHWATLEEQHNNKRTNIRHILDDISLTRSQIARKYGICKQTLKRRLERGLSIEEAVSEEVRRTNFLIITHNGQTKTLKEWSRHLGIPYYKLYQRIFRNGWSFERSITS